MRNPQDNDAGAPRPEAHDEEMGDRSPTVSTRPPTFVASPALKAARTRAFRNNFQAFTADEAEALSPSNVFVRLKISNDKLRQSGMPVLKTKWETEVARKKTARDETSGLDVKSSMPCMVRDTAGAQTVPRGEQRDDMEVEVNSTAVEHSSSSLAAAAGRSTNHVGSPRPVGHVSQSSIIHVGPSSTLTPQTVSHLESLANTSASTHSEGLIVTADRSTQTRDFLNPKENIGIQNLTRPKNPFVSLDLAVKTPSRKRTHHSETIQHGRTTPKKRSSADSVRSESPHTFVKRLREDFAKQVRFDPNSDHLDTANAALTQPSPRSTRKRRSAAALRKQDSNTQNLSGVDRTARQLLTPLLTPDPDNSEINNMAPVRDPNNVDSSLKDAIQKLYEVQSQVHGFVPETQPLLIDKMTEVANSLAHLQKLTSPTLSPNNPIHKNRIAPEVIDYVDDSRNPDIYNREFVELVQRGNAVMNGKQQAFKDFSQTFAEKLREKMPELSQHVDKIMKNAGLDEKKANLQKREDSGANGDIKNERKPDGRKDGESGVNGARVG